MSSIFPIIEGHAEVRAVPILLRRLAELHQNYNLQVLSPFRVPKGQMVNTDQFERAIEYGARKLRQEGGKGGILVLLDADDDCPAELGPQLLARANQARGDIQHRVVIAKNEYEAWFLAAAHSLRGQRSIRQDAEPPPDAEAVRDAKGYLERNLMIDGAYYSETVDQPALTAIFSIDEARVTPSFDKLWRDFGSFLD